MTTLDDLHAEIDFLQRYGLSAAYKDKQIHAIPAMPVIPAEQRIPYIVARCQGLRVLNLGSASGSLHDAIKTSAVRVVGVDHEPGPNTDVWLDLDDYEAMQAWEMPEVDLIVCAETIEHVCNPGWLLRKLKRDAPGIPLLLTTANAHGLGNQTWVTRGYINVNSDHVAWYCVQTLKTLLGKCQYQADAWAYYGSGPVGLNEGIITIAR